MTAFCKIDRTGMGSEDRIWTLREIGATTTRSLWQRVRRRRRGRTQAGDARREREALHRKAKGIIGDARGWRRRMLAHHRASKEDLWRGARRDGAAHVVRQERETDLVGGCGAMRGVVSDGWRNAGEEPYRSSSRTLRGAPS